jgi:hypothetical protein
MFLEQIKPPKVGGLVHVCNSQAIHCDGHRFLPKCSVCGFVHWLDFPTYTSYEINLSNRIERVTTYPVSFSMDTTEPELYDEPNNIGCIECKVNPRYQNENIWINKCEGCLNSPSLWQRIKEWLNG